MKCHERTETRNNFRCFRPNSLSCWLYWYYPIVYHFLPPPLGISFARFQENWSTTASAMLLIDRQTKKHRQLHNLGAGNKKTREGRTTTTTTVLQPFFWDYPGEPVPAEKLLDFKAQGDTNRRRHTDHPAGCHSIRSKQCPPPPENNC